MSIFQTSSSNRTICQRTFKYRWHTKCFADKLSHIYMRQMTNAEYRYKKKTKNSSNFVVSTNEKKQPFGTYNMKRSRQWRGHWKLATYKKASIIIHHMFAILIVYPDRMTVLRSIACDEQFIQLFGLRTMHDDCISYYELNNPKLCANWWCIKRWFMFKCGLWNDDMEHKAVRFI